MRTLSSAVKTMAIAALVFMLVWVAPASSQEEPPPDEVCSEEQCADDPALQDQCETFLTVCLAEANTDADAEQCFGAAILICNSSETEEPPPDDDILEACSQAECADDPALQDFCEAFMTTCLAGASNDAEAEQCFGAAILICNYSESEEDADGDGVPDAEDNCPFNANTDQADEDGDLIGDACDSEEPSPAENLAFLPSVYLLLLLTEQAPADEPEPPPADTDGDGVPDEDDNCPEDANADQADADGDLIGDVCDSEEPPPGDEDILEACSQAECADDPAVQDHCVAFMNACIASAETQPDAEKCFGAAILICRDFSEMDTDGDGVPDEDDNCPSTPNADQADADGDLIGDACDFEEPPPEDEILEACSREKCLTDQAVQDHCVAFMELCIPAANTQSDAEKCFGAALLICNEFETEFEPEPQPPL